MDIEITKNFFKKTAGRELLHPEKKRNKKNSNLKLMSHNRFTTIYEIILAEGYRSIRVMYKCTLVCTKNQDKNNNKFNRAEEKNNGEMGL